MYFDYEGLIGIAQNIVTGVDFRLRSWQHDSWLLFIHLNLTLGLDKANKIFSALFPSTVIGNSAIIP